MNISAAMIVKRGESEDLKRCLDSLDGIVSEIVAVVDPTPVKGDLTDELLSLHNAKEILLPWPSDYSAARNESLKHVTGDWVLVIDTDEYVKSFDFDERAYTADALRLVRENEYTEEDNALMNVERLTRFFKAGPFMYEGRVHEQVIRKDGAPFVTEDVPIILGHTGYTDREQMLVKSKAYRDLLYRMISEEGDDPYTYFQIGRTYYVERDYEKAASAFEKAIESGADTKDEYVESLLETYGYCLLELKENSKALSLLGFNEYADSADYNFLCGLILMNNASFDEAIARFEKAAGCRKYSVAGTNSYAAWYNCGVICEVLGDQKRAAGYYKKSGEYPKALAGLKRVT